MKTLAIFNANEHCPTNYKDRPTAKGIIYNEKNEIALMPGLPGGGVEIGETAEEGLHRECMEELGMKIEIIESIGIIEMYRDVLKKHYVIQGFIAKKVGDLGTPTSKDKDDINADFQSILQWLPIDQVIIFTKNRIKEIEKEGSIRSFEENMKTDYFQSKIYSAQMVLVFLETLKNPSVGFE